MTEIDVVYTWGRKTLQFLDVYCAMSPEWYQIGI